MVEEGAPRGLPALRSNISFWRFNDTENISSDMHTSNNSRNVSGFHFMTNLRDLFGMSSWIDFNVAHFTVGLNQVISVTVGI